MVLLQLYSKPQELAAVKFKDIMKLLRYIPSVHHPCVVGLKRGPSQDIVFEDELLFESEIEYVKSGQSYRIEEIELASIVTNESGCN